MSLEDSLDKSETEHKELELWKQNVKEFNETALSSLEIIDDCKKCLKDFEYELNKFKEKTVPLEILEHNAILAIKELDKVINYHMIGTKYTSLLQSAVPAGELKKYIDAVDICTEAKEYFMENMPNEPDISHFAYLISQGQKNLKREIHSRLLTNFKNYPVDDVLEHSKYADSFLQSFAEGKSDHFAYSVHYPDINFLVDYNIIKEEECNDIKMILKCLYTSEELTNEFIAFYEEARISIIVTALGTLKEKFISTTINYNDQSTLDSLDLSTSLSLKDESILEIPADVRSDSFFYIVKMFAAFVVMITMENKLMDELIPEMRHNTVLSSIALALLEKCSSEVDSLIKYAHQKCSENDILIYLNLVISILPLMEFLFIYKSLFEAIIKPRFINPRRKLRSIVNNVQNEIFSILIKFKLFKEENIEKLDVKYDSNIHEFTSNTLTAIFSLVNHSNVIGFILENMKNVTKEQVSKEKGDVDFIDRSWDDNSWKLMKSIINSMESFLVEKASSYPDDVSRCLFLINNYYYIIQRFTNYTTTNDLLIQNFINVVITEFKRKLKNEYDNFETCWLKVLGCLTAVNDSELSKSVAEFQYSGKNLNVKLKSQIKNTFKTFNTEMETITDRIKTLIPPPKAVQRDLSEKILSMIVPVYENFLRICGDIPFTSKTNKYIKFSKQSLTLTIQEIFVKRHGIVNQASIGSLREQSRRLTIKKN